jgi:retinol dehydrogenase 14
MMKGKTVLITGTTSGIGKATAKALAAKDASLILVAQNEEKVKQLIQEIKSETGNDKLKYYIADLASNQSIAQLGDKINAEVEHLDVLLNNAGLIVNDRKLSADGYEYTFALDHLGYYHLTGRLLKLLHKSSPSRIISVSSGAQQAGHINFDDLMGEKNYSAFRAYCQAKLANVLFTYELARKLEGTGITANCLHPGVVNTNFGSDMKGFSQLMMKLFKPFMIRADKGAETSIYLASSPEVEGVTGKYFVKKKVSKTSGESYDEAVARRLWKVSEELTGFKYPELK